MVELVLKYKDIFPSDFLNNFGEKKELIENIILSEDEFSIDLKKIASILEISIEPTFYDKHSGQYDSEQKKIYINVSESEKQKRFTTARALRHYVLGHESISNWVLSSKDYFFVNSIKERAANQFAVMLLIPKRLLAKAIERYQKNKNMTDEQLENSNIKELILELSDMLNVSERTMRYRLINLGVIATIKP